MSGMRAVIVGAGVGGLTLALLLRQRGITAEVVEQAPELREAGAAIALASNATKVLVHLGLGDDLAAASTQPTAVIHRDGRDGHPVSAHPMGGWYRRTFGAPFYGLHRPACSSLERHGDGHVVVGPVHDLDLVIGLDLARLDHPEVRTGPGGEHKALDPVGLRQPTLEGAARNPWAGHLQDHVRPDPPALADQGGVAVDALGGQVLAEDAVRQRLAKLGLSFLSTYPKGSKDQPSQVRAINSNGNRGAAFLFRAYLRSSDAPRRTASKQVTGGARRSLDRLCDLLHCVQAPSNRAVYLGRSGAVIERRSRRRATRGSKTDPGACAAEPALLIFLPRPRKNVGRAPGQRTSSQRGRIAACVSVARRCWVLARGVAPVRIWCTASVTGLSDRFSCRDQEQARVQVEDLTGRAIAG